MQDPDHASPGEDPWSEDGELDNQPDDGAHLANASKERGQNPRNHLWCPEPVNEPEIDRQLSRLPWPERCAEALRFTALRAERWISPGGVLREWLRLNLWVGIALLALSLLVVPPVTLLLEGAADWATLIKATALNVTATVAGLPPVIVAVATGYLAYRLLNRGWRRRRSNRHYHDQGDHYGMQ